MERRVLLEKDPIAVGTAWARAVCDNITQQGRVIAGGWPGTLVEARARISSRLHDELFKRGMKALEPEELEQAVNATYARAKQEWLETERRAERAARSARRPRD
jgi:hypothetical protein